jgi:hypothetical protein
MGKDMKSYILRILFFITLFGSIDALAQNVTHMVGTPKNEPAPAATAPASTTPIDLENTLVKIEVIGLRGSFFKLITPPPASKGMIGDVIDRATEITREAYFQRQRFNETGQPIEIDRDHLYYRRDGYSYTKGIVFCELLKGRIDFGLYRKHFSPATTYLSGKMAPDFGQQDSDQLLFRNGSRVFFSLRVKIPMP